jgi:hypothetical protein
MISAVCREFGAKFEALGFHAGWADACFVSLIASNQMFLNSFAFDRLGVVQFMLMA